MAEMRFDLPGERIEPAGIVDQREVDVPSVLFFESVVKSHALHHQEGDNRRYPDTRLVSSAFRQFAPDVSFDKQVERKIATAGLACTAFVNELSTMFRASPFVFAGQEVNLHF